MKNFIIISIIALLTAGWSFTSAQEFPEEYLGLPGDNLNLYGVMKLFQESETLEDFERSLNDENSMINNLDLNGDNLVDYIMVFDYSEGDFHTIVLRVALDERETQDVAVFTVQQFNDGSVQVQLIGDELLYGKNYIVEPYYAENAETPNPGYVGNTRNSNKVTVVHTTTYQVAEWPIVRYIYLPTYVAWRSSWYWGYRPVYWNPWRPFYWHTYYGYHYHWQNHYYTRYRHWNNYRYPRYKNHYYTSIRTYSPRITVNINKGVYKSTYSRPDLRKQGEVLYARNNSGRNSTTYKSVENGRTRSASTTNVRSARTNIQSNNAGTRSTVRSSAETRNSDERKSATVNSSRNSTNSTVRQSSGATRNSGVNSSRGTTTTRSARTSSGSEVNQGTSGNTARPAAVSSNRNVKSSTPKDNSGAVRSSSANAPQRSAVSSQARTSAPKKSETISTGNSASRPSVSRSTSSKRSSAPSVSRQSAPKTKSATSVSSSRSSSRQSSTPSVSRSSSSGSSRTAAPKSSNTRSSSTRSSGRR